MNYEALVPFFFGWGVASAVFALAAGNFRSYQRGEFLGEAARGKWRWVVPRNGSKGYPDAPRATPIDVRENPGA